MTEVENVGEVLRQVYIIGGSFRLVTLCPAMSSNKAADARNCMVGATLATLATRDTSDTSECVTMVMIITKVTTVVSF
jgi:hypothetical protein